MKRRLCMVMLALVCLVLLTGCGCEHEWAEADCTTPKTCTLCGKTEGEPLGHDWIPATCEDPKICRICGEEGTEAVGHSWAAATCDTPRTCEICGATDGDPLGHHWLLTAEDQLTCQVCGETTQPKYIAITFDDGPSGQYTTTLLEGLSQRGARATFFLCGYRLENAQSLAQEIADHGHEIGLHGYSHTLMSNLTYEEILQELRDTRALTPNGSDISLMRPPGGDITAGVRQATSDMGLSIILWSVDPEDWNTDDAAEIEESILSQAQPGDIILMHDMSTSSVEAALYVIDELSSEGYVFVTVSELARLNGQNTEPGQVYTHFSDE